MLVRIDVKYAFLLSITMFLWIVSYILLLLVITCNYYYNYIFFSKCTCPLTAMVWTLNDEWQNFSFGSLVRKNILPRVMLVKNIVKSKFFCYYLPLQYNNLLQKSFVFQVLQKSCHFWKEVLLWGKGSHKAPGLQTKNISGPEEIIFSRHFHTRSTGVKNCHFWRHIP